MLLERLLITLAVLSCLALLPLLTRVVAGATRRKAQQGVDGLPLHPHQPTVIYFWSHDCHQCRAAQAPALDRLAAEGSAHVVPIDAVAERTLADRFGVLTVPTTIVLAPSGEVRAVNHGFASLPKLRGQVA